ncbi:EXO5 [Candida jiufengensis]|uniref:EXO5 n=1 Tax=Candida jiufengensis TaxID=497108 RepID=UPI00222503AC|nr:EXO5 [Candida jiufengensis]KAI5951091.1 EXO5 [Candida jiufengensis]
MNDKLQPNKSDNDIIANTTIIGENNLKITKIEPETTEPRYQPLTELKNASNEEISQLSNHIESLNIQIKQEEESKLPPPPKKKRGRKKKHQDPNKLKNQNLEQIFENWKLPHTQDLPTINPTNISPYKFYTTTNSDESIIRSPRLSVTKLLVNTWCQLRDYYQIYAGSNRLKGVNVKAGHTYHSKLELETHEFENIEQDMSLINLNVENLKSQTINKEELAVLEKLSEFNINDQLANDWCDKIISRLFNLVVNSEAREVLVHGYVNLNEEKLITSENFDGFNDSVLISGVIDLLKFINTNDPTNLDFFVEIQNMIDLKFSTKNSTRIDLTSFFKEISEILTNYNKQELNVNIMELKSRSWNQLPNYDSVLKSAKYQTYYYKNMFTNLSQDSKFTYYSLLRNAEIRGCNVDEPLNQILVLKLIRLYSDFLYDDFLKLCNGEPIGFELFDNHILKNKEPYNFGLLFQDNSFSLNDSSTSQFLQDLDEQENSNFNYSELLKPLLKPWKTPPTLRYLASRSSQFYTIFQNFINEEYTYVEYHNSKTEKNFKTIKYKYNPVIFQQQLKQACEFWKGTTKPEFVDNLNKCKYCDFATRCMVAKNEINENLNEFNDTVNGNSN